MDRQPIPLSELPHRKSQGLDQMSSEEVAALFASSEPECLEALLRPETLDRARALLRTWMDMPPKRLVLGGAGTSGRLAWHLADRFREPLASLGVEVEAWIAGGSQALVLAVEGAEDNFEGALSELRARIGSQDGFFLGISCGLSAPCVAAGVTAAMDLCGRAAVFGVNPPDEARAEPLPGLPGGFRGMLADLADEPRFTLIHAPVGPELLTGSSRLKGGTATWVLLEAMLATWCDRGGPDLATRMQASMREAQGVVEQAGPWIQAAGDCLRLGGSIHYLGSGDEGRAGLLDASECGPTFGAQPGQIQAWFEGGWPGLGLESGTAMPRLSLRDFDGERAPGLSSKDLVFLLGGVERELPTQVVPLDVQEFLPTKLLLNAISTGAFVQAGKVWGNRMIDLALSNHKLFDRACRILEDLRGQPADACYRSLVAAIWDEDRPRHELLRLPAEAHLARVREGGSASGYVPLALLHLEGIDLAEARKEIARQPVLRKLLAR